MTELGIHMLLKHPDRRVYEEVMNEVKISSKHAPALKIISSSMRIAPERRQPRANPGKM